MMVSGETVFGMDWENKNGQMVQSMRETGLKTNHQEKEN